MRRINGVALTSPERALEVVQKLSQWKQVEVEVDRRGEPLTRTYDLR